MAFPQGIDFRNTSGFVTDPTNYTFEIHTGPNYPTVTPQGNTVGWTSAGTVGTADRSSSIDARLAGIAFVANGGSVLTYEIDLPAAGSYQIGLALGDDLPAARPNIQLQILDNTTLLTTINANVPSGDSADATNTNYTEANWPASNSMITLTFASTKAIFNLGTSGSDFSTWQNVFIQAAAAAAAIDQSPLMVGVNVGRLLTHN